MKPIDTFVNLVKVDSGTGEEQTQEKSEELKKKNCLRLQRSLFIAKRIICLQLYFQVF